MAHSTLCTVDGGVRWFFRFFFLEWGLPSALQDAQQPPWLVASLFITFYCCDRIPYVSNLRRNDLLEFVISEVSSHGHLVLLLLTLCIVEQKSWGCGGWLGEQSSLHQDGQEAERRTHRRKVEENTLQWHALLPSDTLPPIRPRSYFPHLQKCHFIETPSRDQSTD